MGKKKSYVVSVFVPVTVQTLVYAEVIAESREAAIRSVKRNFDSFKLEEGILEDAKVMLEEREVKMGKVGYTADRANQFHDVSDCQICKTAGEK